MFGEFGSFFTLTGGARKLSQVLAIEYTTSFVEYAYELGEVLFSDTIREGGDRPWFSGDGLPLERGEERGWRGVEVALLIVDVVSGIWPFLNGLFLLSTEEKRESVVAAAVAAAEVDGE